MGDRDARGRFVPGHSIKGVGAGRPPRAVEEKLLTSLSDAVMVNGTMAEAIKALREKLKKADPWAMEFVYDRLLGKPRQSVDLSADAQLQEFVAWMQGDETKPGDSSATDPPPNNS